MAIVTMILEMVQKMAHVCLSKGMTAHILQVDMNLLL